MYFRSFGVDPQEMSFSLVVCDFEAVPTHTCFLFWIDEGVAKNEGTKQLAFCSGKKIAIFVLESCSCKCYI